MKTFNDVIENLINTNQKLVDGEIDVEIDYESNNEIGELSEKDAGESTAKIEVCPMFNAEKFIEKTILNLQKEVQRKALIAFSGRVDSTVCAVLVNKAIGEVETFRQAFA